MPSTFAGAYIKEPSDLQVVATEADIISVCDDPGGEDARDVQVFADLTVPQKAAVVGVMNSLIPPVENLVESYARRRGYAIPLNPVDSVIVELCARLVWISMRQRAKSLTGDAAEDQREMIRRGQLRDIADGRLMLTAAMSDAAVPSAATVYSFSDAASRDTDKATPRMSRSTLGGL